MKLIPEDPESFSSIAEDSRPAKRLNDKFQQRCRKSGGRKKKKTRKGSTYVNWLEPFLFRRIKAAARIAGGPNMSVRHIVKELHRQDHKTFARISPNTINAWIDRSGPAARWSAAVLQRAERGHEPGHTNGGRKGIFVSNDPAITQAITH